MGKESFSHSKSAETEPAAATEWDWDTGEEKRPRQIPKPAEGNLDVQAQWGGGKCKRAIFFLISGHIFYVSLVALYFRSVEKITRPRVISRMWTLGSRKTESFAGNQLGRIRASGDFH